jgi:hypothetical protein
MPYKFNPFTGKLDNAPGAPVFPDNKFTVFDDGDKTRRFQFQASGISPATTRTLDIQDVDGPVAIGYGLANQYIRGDATLANFPVAAGGGSSVSYYFNGSVSQGTILGDPYFEINKIPAGAAQTNFALTTASDTAYFITDASDPNLLLIPQGNFTFQLYCSTSAGTPQIAVELYKYDGAAFTQIGATSPAVTIANTTSDIHFLTVAVPAATTLALTDRLAVRVIASSLGANTLTLNTEGNTQSQIITTFSTGLAALNGLTDQVQFLATGTAGTNFNIVSSAATHTFNIPTASAVNRGALSSADWTTFNNKIGAGLYTATTGLTMNADRLLGRTTAGTGAAEEITVGTGLSLTAGTLTNTALGVTSVTATAPITSSGGTTPDISTSIATNKVVGRSTAGTGVMEELTPVGITVSAGNITGIGGTVGTVDNAVPRADSTGGYTVQGSDIIIDDATASTQNNVAIVNAHSETNSALVLSPKGTGAFILGPKPDNGATGGQPRGSRSVDLQLSRTSSNHIAAGANSAILGGSNNNCFSAHGVVCGGNANGTGAASHGFIGGGQSNGLSNNSATHKAIGGGLSNSVSGAYGIVAAGRSNTVSADYGNICGGYLALADRYGQQSHASGQFAAQGDAQRARFVMRNKTTTNSAVELFLDGSAARLTIPSGKIFAFTINISGVKSDGSAVAHYLRQYCLKNVAGTTSEVYAPVTIGSDNAAGTSIAISADDTRTTPCAWKSPASSTRHGAGSPASMQSKSQPTEHKL